MRTSIPVIPEIPMPVARRAVLPFKILLLNNRQILRSCLMIFWPRPEGKLLALVSLAYLHSIILFLYLQAKQTLMGSSLYSNATRPDAESPGPSRASPTSFRGSGQTLGGEGTESRVIPDPDAPPASSSSSRGGGRNRPQNSSNTNNNEQVQERTLHLWQDGFSIDDGELRRFDDPANADALRMIQQGRAPVHLMNVRFDEPLDVKLQQHAENWRPLPKVYKPFGGEGRRLGSPVPGDSSASTTTTTTTTLPTVITSTLSTSSTPSGGAAAPPTVDESQPTVSIRIQMPDGARLPARFNTTQTVGDIYEFVARASPELRSGGWVVATTFPNKDHTDKSLVLGELAEFKKGGTAVVKRST